MDLKKHTVAHILHVSKVSLGVLLFSVLQALNQYFSKFSIMETLPPF